MTDWEEGVICIMPEYNRPQFSSQAVWMFDRQTYEPRHLLVVTDGPAQPYAEHVQQVTRERTVKGTASMAANINRALEVIKAGDVPPYSHVAFWESDDWYHPDRLAFQMKHVGNLLAHGFPSTVYYHIGKRHFRRIGHPERASNCGTLIKRDWIVERGFPSPPEVTYPDVALWKELNKWSSHQGSDIDHVIGIKHGAEGQSLGNSHVRDARPEDIADPEMKWLADRVDADSLAFYRRMGGGGV